MEMQTVGSSEQKDVECSQTPREQDAGDEADGPIAGRLHDAIQTTNPEDINTKDLLQSLYARYIGKKAMFRYAAGYYNNLNLFVFFFPILLMQVLITVFSELVQDHEHLKLVNIITSSAATLWIGAQMKLKWGERSQKYAQTSRTYSYLATDTFYRLAVTRSGGGDLREFNKFYNLALNMEREAVDSCAPVPHWVARKYRAFAKDNMETGGGGPAAATGQGAHGAAGNVTAES